MKFLIDENIPKMSADKILEKYPESVYVLSSNLQGKNDLEIFRFCKKNRYILVTFEYTVKNTEGRILLRFKNLKHGVRYIHNKNFKKRKNN